MPLEKGLSSGHEIPEEEQREQELEENDQKKDKNEENKDEAEAKEEEKGKDSPDSNSGDQSDQFIEIELEEIRREVECPICLGIIKKTRTMMKCLHRFCGECIEKSLRLGNNECPVCRTHCPSRRFLRDDVVSHFDGFIATLFPNIDKFEEEELKEEEKARNKRASRIYSSSIGTKKTEEDVKIENK